MASQLPKAKDPLDALQLLVNDVLVQTGKALRASRRDSSLIIPSPVYGAMPAKLPDTIKAFHQALDELDMEIIRAKSVVLRDLNELQAQKTPNEPDEQPQPLNKKSPPTIDLEASPVTTALDHRPIKTEPVMKPVAPFPDMGMSLPEAAQSSMTVKEDQPLALTPEANNASTEGGTSAGSGAMMSATEHQPMRDQPPHVPESNETLNINANPRLNFTDMEFTLAPTNSDPQNHPGGEDTDLTAAEPSFDLASFVPADGVDNGNAIGSSSNNNNSQNGNGTQNHGMASLDSILPANLTAPTNASNNNATDGKPDGRSAEVPDAAFSGIFTGEGQTDGMDFDFSIGDGGMGDTFDDLMNDRDNTFSTIEHGDFDAAFFGLDKPDGS
ncbi:hypothetical protein GQ602_005668 [Ophiocordyceps camponoti-floridani]|uniref:Uncharacterized protein n=1 Tax=Ophiocordyceps camponoti-floridani TaxID=2030778 RepID=A0A8H4Q3T2_9HYPO|nr:hypothetical protein GQ602_005668 [Ophiocordyceps camponoti-floridani]